MVIKQRIVWTMLLTIVIGLLLIAYQPAEAVSGLPTRPLPPPAPAAVRGGFIELHASNGPAAGWTAVQWQDGAGKWHIVDGWQGSLDADGRIRWYVGEEILGRGPFRWLVFDAPDGDVQLISEAFWLPGRSREETTVNK